MPKNTTGRTEGRLACPGQPWAGGGVQIKKRPTIRVPGRAATVWKSFLCAATGSGYRPGPHYRLIPGSGQRSALAVRRGWFPVVGVRRTTATAPDPARAAISGPRFGGSFVGVQPSICGPLGRTGERFPDLMVRGKMAD